MSKHNLIREIREIKNHISYSKQIGFFFGAGTSCALGVPNIDALTKLVQAGLNAEIEAQFNIIKTDLATICSGREPTIEDILNHIRQIRALTGERDDKEYIGINGVQAKMLDDFICKNIYEIIDSHEQKANLTKTKTFFAWLSMLNRDFSTEVFTTNYDLIIEKSLEEIKIPYFDGFVGSFEPFFWQESIERITSASDMTHRWMRLWKIHGSLSWFWKENSASKTHRIVRIGKVADIKANTNELVIYPSKEKYESSKKQPFVAYFDRLKSYLQSGELLFVFTGYSFSDQHINDIIFNSLRQNNRLHALVLFFKDEEVETLYKTSASILNLTIMGPTKGVISGAIGDWEYLKDDLKSNEDSDSYWDSSSEELRLGDFNRLVDFLVYSSRNKESIKVVVDEK